MINRRRFLLDSSGLAAGSFLMNRMPWNNSPSASSYLHRLPKNDDHYQVTCGYVEEVPVSTYTWAPDQAYEDFKDIKFGIRLHWGLYSILGQHNESWPFLKMSLEERQNYQQLYKSWYPAGFDADAWVDFFADSGARMFAFTSKHHDGFSMFDTSATITKNVNWLANGGPAIEDCGRHYSIMETPFKRDVVKELTDAAHRKKIKVDLYFSHPDWYDADFRPYNYHPLQTPSAATLAVQGSDKRPELENAVEQFGKSGPVIRPDPTSEEINRMMKRHRQQLEELLTRYGKIDMVCLDQWLGPQVWPMLRDTLHHLRKLRPDVMFRARGIGNYGDYYTPEGFVPGSKENSDTPWFVIYPLGETFSYDGNAKNYKGSGWIVNNLIDAVAKGGNFMAAVGPDGNGMFHPSAVHQLKETGAWLRINGEGIYATRPRDNELWKEGDNIRFTRSKDASKLFAFALKWPGAKLSLKTVRPKRGSQIRLMGSEVALHWAYDKEKGVEIELPEALRASLPEISRLGYGFRIEQELQ